MWLFRGRERDFAHISSVWIWLVFQWLDVFAFTCLDRPLTYVYNTLHYYDRRLQDRASLKRKIVSVIIGKILFETGFFYALAEEIND